MMFPAWASRIRAVLCQVRGIHVPRKRLTGEQDQDNRQERRPPVHHRPMPPEAGLDPRAGSDGYPSG